MNANIQERTITANLSSLFSFFHSKNDLSDTQTSFLQNYILHKQSEYLHNPALIHVLVSNYLLLKGKIYLGERIHCYYQLTYLDNSVNFFHF